MADPAPRPDPAQVRHMFDRIAPWYDTMNTVMTVGIDRHWRADTIAALRLTPGARLLDVATGTGKLAVAGAGQVAPGGTVVAVDVSRAMLLRARRAETARRSPGDLGGRGGSSVAVEWREADAMDMPFDDGSFDAVSIGFGLRNLPDLDAGLREMARVLRPGGRLAVLEIAEPPGGAARLLFATWFRRAVPLLGRAIGRSAAYAYLPASLDRYPPPAGVAERIEAAGFAEVRWSWLRSGLATLHVGVRTGGAGSR